MSTPLIIEPLLGEARAAAMAGGLKTVCHLQIRVGEGSGIDLEELTQQLRSYFVGALLGSCDVGYESGEGTRIQLVSIEGYVVSSVPCS